MLEQKSRDQHDRPDQSDRSRSSSNLEQLADEARAPSARYTAPLMFLAGAIIAVAVAFLVAQNGESTTVEWLAWDPTGPMWIVLVLTFVAGLVTGPLLLGALSLARHHRHEREERIEELAHPS